jgi:hypothetical protein
MNTAGYRIVCVLGLALCAGAVTLLLNQTAFGQSGHGAHTVQDVQSPLRSGSIAAGEPATITFACCSYFPPVITVTVGQSLTWQGSFGFHPLQQVTDATGFTPVAGGYEYSGNASSFSQVFTQTGTNYYICTAHAASGMRGEIRVVDQQQPPTDTTPSCLTYDVVFQKEPEISGTVAATGTARFILNTRSNTLAYTIVYTGLSSAESNAHFHGFTPPAVSGAPLPGQPLRAGTSPKIGVWNYDSEDIEAKILAGQVYVNIHTVNNPGGEIRAILANPKPCLKLFLPMALKP